MYQDKDKQVYICGIEICKGKETFAVEKCYKKKCKELLQITKKEDLPELEWEAIFEELKND